MGVVAMEGGVDPPPPPRFLAWSPRTQAGPTGPLAVGEPVFTTAFSGKLKPVGHAVVEEPSTPKEAKWGGRPRCRFLIDGNTAHLEVKKLVRSLTWGRRETVVAVVEETDDFRRLARTQVRPRDRVVEVGSNLGATSVVLRQSLSCDPTALEASQLLAVDIAPHCVEVTREAMEADAARLVEGLMPAGVCQAAARTVSQRPALLEHFREVAPNKVFLDIGGTERLADVALLLREVLEVCIEGLELVVFKNRDLYHSLREEMEGQKEEQREGEGGGGGQGRKRGKRIKEEEAWAGGWLPHGSAWWARVSALK